MKKLYLVRHAKSSWDEPELSDFERSLNERGRRDAPLMAQRLLARNLSPDRWLSSSATRAWQTALALSKGMHVPESALVAEPALYHAEPELILQVIHAQPDTSKSLILFGHNPGLTDFASLICGHRFDNIPTCGVVGVSFEINLWKEVDFHLGKLLFFDYPKNPDGRES